jgi:hypothetical protein
MTNLKPEVWYDWQNPRGGFYIPMTNQGDFRGIAPCRTAEQARRTLPVEKKSAAERNLGME